MTTTQTIDEAKLNEFMGRFVGDLGAALSAALVVIGDRLGLYRAMADGEPVHRGGARGSAPAPTRATCASGSPTRPPAATSAMTRRSERFFLTPEQSFALAQEGSPAFVPGAFQLATALIKDEPKITAAFRSGEGVGWHEHNHDLFAGTERFFRPGYTANLVSAGSPRSTACRRSSRRARSSPTSAAGTAPRR